MNGIVVRRAAAALCLLAVCVHAYADAPIDESSLRKRTYDGVTDDLLSGGLNQNGLEGGVPGVDPTDPNSLRRRAIYQNYRAIVDPVPAGGMGLLWGPKLAPSIAGATPGLIPGVEYKAYLRLPERHKHVNNIPAAVQIPQHFNMERPCIVAALPSGSRSVYGAISLAEWALFKGCAVALPGKGTDTGFHLLGDGTSTDAVGPYAVDDVDGVAGSVEALSEDAQFAVRDSRRLREYVGENPHRVATKHAHSQINPERLWGEFALQGIEFAFWALNDHFPGKRFTRENTLVIAAGASNGGGVALRALEDDRRDLIDGVVVTEPNIQPRDGRIAIQFGDDPPFDPEGRTLYDSITLMSVYAACAMQSPTLTGTPFFGFQPLGVNRCTSLGEKGLVTGDTTAEQAADALAKIRAHGYAEAQDWGIASHEVLNLWRSLQATYANAYGRFAVERNLCGVSFAAIDAATSRPAPLAADPARRLFADSSGVPATGGISLIADKAANSPILENLAQSRSSSPPGRLDLNLDSALCFRALQTGERIQAAEGWADFARVRQGTREVQTTGKLRGKPVIIIHGRRDALVFPNLHSRAYYALNQEVEGRRSRTSYIEVSTGQHFDAFISLLFGGQFAPLHYYFVQAMDAMYAHLTTGSGSALPPSQVVRPTPRGAQPYSAANVPALLPAMAQNPAAGDRITFQDGVLRIPE